MWFFFVCLFESKCFLWDSTFCIKKRGKKKRYVYFLKVETSYTFFFPPPFQWDLHNTSPFGFRLRFLLHFKTLTTDSGSRTFLGGDGWNTVEVWKSWLFAWARGIISCSSSTEPPHVTGFPVSSGGQGERAWGLHSRQKLSRQASPLSWTGITSTKRGILNNYLIIKANCKISVIIPRSTKPPGTANMHKRT